MHGKVPATIITVAVERIYYQCPKALARSRLWAADAQIPRSSLPSSGQMQKGLSGDGFDAEAHDRAYPAPPANHLPRVHRHAPANHLPTAFTATLGEVVAPGLAGRLG